MGGKVYRVGIIGAGFMGKTHTYNYLTLPFFYDDLPYSVQLCGICDTDLNKAEKHREDFGFEFATDDYTEIIDRKDIDIIDISTPTVFHYRQIIDGLQTGKHLYIDKPLCMTDEEAEEIERLAARSTRIHQMAYHYRFFPAILKTKELLDLGFLGKPISFRIVYYHSSNLDPEKPMGWKQEKSMGGGGVLIEMACHVIDLIYHFFGAYEHIDMDSLILYPQRPDSTGKMVDVEGEDHVLLKIRMKNGMLGTMEVSKVVAGSNDDLNFELFGTGGAVKFEFMNPNFLQVYDAGGGGSAPESRRGYRKIETVNKYIESKSNFPGPRFPIGWIRGHVASQYNFLKCVHDNIPPSPSLYEGAYIQRITDAVYKGADVSGIGLRK